MEEKEIWAPFPIPQYAPFYLISSHGRVRDVVTRQLVPTGTRATGLTYVTLIRPVRKKGISLSQYVAKAFIPNPRNKRRLSVIDKSKPITAGNLMWGYPPHKERKRLKKLRNDPPKKPYIEPFKACGKCKRKSASLMLSHPLGYYFCGLCGYRGHPLDQ